jgi:hypothetical protein
MNFARAASLGARYADITLRTKIIAKPVRLWKFVTGGGRSPFKSSKYPDMKNNQMNENLGKDDK